MENLSIAIYRRILDSEVTLLVNSNIDGINLFNNVSVLDFQFYVQLISTKLTQKAKDLEEEKKKLSRR